MRFTRGLKDGLPIALGYVPVAFAYAIGAVGQGFPPWFPILISATNFTGTGQFAGTNLIAAGASLAVLFATMLVINIRYTLMSVSIAQKLDGHFPLWQRLAVSFGVTDENYAVAMQQPRKLAFPYLMGLMSCSFAGWLGGTALGAGLSALLSALLSGDAAAWYDILMSAFNISLYAMFVAIILPPARGDRKVLLLVAMSVAGSCLFYFIPALHALPSGVDIIVVSVLCTVILALLFPRDDEEDITQDKPPKTQSDAQDPHDAAPDETALGDPQNSDDTAQNGAPSAGKGGAE